MKKIHLLVIKAFIRPFIVTFFIVMFVLLMLFLFKYIDDLIGKGLEWYVVLQLMWYASATNVAMALPLTMLLSSIMTFGSLGESYELVAIKSVGVSLQKAMMPLVILISILSICAFLFSNYMLPIANQKFYSLLYDATTKKAALSFQEGVFNNTFPGYSIRIEKRDDDKQTLHNVLIYNQNPSTGNMTTLMAKSGRMYMTDDNDYLILKLVDGVRYEESSGSGANYNPRQRLMRYRFKETEQKFSLAGFKFQRTDESFFKNNYAMLNLQELQRFRDSVQIVADSGWKTVYPEVKANFKMLYSNYKIPGKSVKSVGKKYTGITSIIPVDKRLMAIANAQTEANGISAILKTKISSGSELETRIHRYIIEYQKKFTLAASCLVLFFIGAPLGAIIRKGGLGLPVVMSIIFFLIYHIISTIGDKSAREGSISPILGVWIAIIILTPVGIFLTYKATADSALFDVDYYKQAFLKFFKRKES